MKVLGLDIENVIEEQTTIYKCPYCTKKFINKHSYYNHIKGKYCQGYFLEFEITTQRYKNKKMTKKEYYQWCYENGYAHFINLDEATKKELGEELFNKISSLYEDEDWED